MSLVFGSVFSGIEAASVAWHPLGWRAAFFSEIAKFPSAVLAHHYPDVPNHGDITRSDKWPDARIDVLCGGPPCQSDSVAGKRGGMADPRGALKANYVAVVRRFLPRWVLFEGVPGVRSVDGGRAFGSLVGELAKLGYGVAWTSLDAQHFGVAQRRERVFAVGYLGAWQPAAAVLFDPESLRGDSPPRRQPREGVAGTLSARTEGGGGLGTDFELGGGLIAPTLLAQKNATGGDRPPGTTVDTCESLVPVISNALSARDSKGQNSGCDQGAPLLVVPFDETQKTHPENRSRTKPGDPSPALARGARPPTIAFNARQDPDAWEERCGPLDTDGSTQAFAFNIRGREGGAMPECDPDNLACQRAASGGSSRSYVATVFKPSHFTRDKDGAPSETVPPLTADADKGDQDPALFTGQAVRRLTPRECERLQGFPDDYTAIPYRGKPAADGPRYAALGNSWAVPCVVWIGRRIQIVDRALEP